MSQEKPKKKGWIFAAIGVVAVLAVLFFVLTRGKEKSYRNIRVMKVSGEVTANREKKSGIKLYENMNLLSGDEIITAKGAQLTLRLDEDKYIVLDENSKLLLHATGTAEDSKTKLELEYGAVFSDIKNKLSESSDYEVATPFSTMSVRGTQFEVLYRELRGEDGTLQGKQIKVLTFEGAVAVAPVGKEEEERVAVAGTLEVLVEKEDGAYEFEGEAKQIEAEDLSEFSANYLKEDISKNIETMPEEERKEKEALLEKVEKYLETVVPEPTKTPEPTATPAPTATPVPAAEHATVKYYVPQIFRSFDDIAITDAMDVVDRMSDYVWKATTEKEVSLEEEVSTHFAETAKGYVEQGNALTSAIAFYGEGTTITCDGWMDAGGKFYSNTGGERFSDLGLQDGDTLELYAVYTIHTAAGTYKGTPCFLDTSILTDFFPLDLTYVLEVPVGTQISLPKLAGCTVNWMKDGAVLDTDRLTVEGTLNHFGLSFSMN